MTWHQLYEARTASSSTGETVLLSLTYVCSDMKVVSYTIYIDIVPLQYTVGFLE